MLGRRNTSQPCSRSRKEMHWLDECTCDGLVCQEMKLQIMGHVMTQSTCCDTDGGDLD